MTDCSLNRPLDSMGKRIFFSPKYRDRRSKVRYNLFDGSLSRNGPCKYIHRRTKGHYNLLEVSLKSDPYGSDISVLDAVRESVLISKPIRSGDSWSEKD